LGLREVPSLLPQNATVNSSPSALNEENEQRAYSDVSEALFYGDIKAQQSLAQKVVDDVAVGISADTFDTGSARYNAEWAAGSYQMAVLGLGQILLAHPELETTYLPVMERSVAQLLTPEINQFGTDAWSQAGLTALDANGENNRGHAYLGYANLALSMLRLHQPNSPFAAANDQLSAAFLQQLRTNPYGIVETYPDEVYPADIAAVIASIALHDTATTGDRQAEILALTQRFYERFVDADTGMVIQAVDASTGEAVDRPRASGSALSAYYLAFADAEVATQLFQSVSGSQVLQLPIGAAIKEYPVGEQGAGDIDSGEIVMGASPSATAFAIGGARLTNNEALYRNLYQTVLLLSDDSGLGSILDEGSVTSLIESPLGRSILLAMLTASEAE